MKKITLVLSALMLCAMVNAQSSTQVATLKHDSTLLAFYGSNAFVDACNAADTGDVITLSKGVYNPPTIRKKLTIRGVGMEDDGTQVTGSCYIYADSINMEGLYFTSSLTFRSNCYAYLSHVSIKRFYSDNMNYVKGTVNNCRIAEVGNSNVNITYVNSSLQSCTSFSGTCINCVVKGYQLQGLYENCILMNSSKTIGSNYMIFTGSTTTSNNCVAYNPNNLNNISGGVNTNLRIVNSGLFKDYQDVGSSSVSFQSFELTDSAKTAYLGGDSTQVGLYGGFLPFTKYSIPRISQLSVSRSTTADGKLSVSVTIDEGVTNDDEE